MKTSRRNLFKFVGGSAVGALFTPVPWRLITDTALWSENWPGIPVPARGESRTRFTNCSLCTAGCAVRARLNGEQPVALAPVPGHPVSLGALCPFGLTGHHLPYHPARVKSGPVKEAQVAVADAIAKGDRVAVLDLRPGRTASWTYRRAMAAIRNGAYIAPPQPLGAATAVNLAEAKTVLSFGAPVLEGWGTPGNIIALRDRFRLIQVDAVESRTAALADLWVSIRPGTETALAMGIANVLGGATNFTPAQAAAATGISEAQVRRLAAEISQNGPAVVLDAAGSSSVLALNTLIGAPGRTLVTRREAPLPEAWTKAAPATELADIPERSVRVLLIDESAPGEYIPWGEIEKKLVAANPVVIAFAWSRAGYGRYAHYVLPAAVYPETLEDIPPAIDTVAPVFRLAVPLTVAPAGMVNPSEFIAAAAGLTVGDALRERSDAIHHGGRGALVTNADGQLTPVKDIKPDDFWKALNAGGCWLHTPDEKAPPPRLALADPKARSEQSADLPLVAVLTEARGSAAPASPLMSKLNQESNLRLGPGRAALHPATAAACGIEEGARATLETAQGRREIVTILDSGVPPGVVKVAALPGVLDMCAAGAPAKVVPA
jgi:anaerobic selenocysteine-containing dehydrogenase